MTIYAKSSKVICLSLAALRLRVEQDGNIGFKFRRRSLHQWRRLNDIVKIDAAQEWRLCVVRCRRQIVRDVSSDGILWLRPNEHRSNRRCTRKTSLQRSSTNFMRRFKCRHLTDATFVKRTPRQSHFKTSEHDLQDATQWRLQRQRHYLFKIRHSISEYF